MHKESKEFACLRQKFPRILVSEANMKKGIFIDPQITNWFKDQDFSTKLNSTERRAWKAFENVTETF